MFFDYHLPDHLIAQHPAARRDEARLLVVHHDTGAIDHRVFRDLPDLLSPGDLLVLNDTKVLPARLVGRRAATGGRWEGLFLRRVDGLWELLCQTRGYAREGEAFAVEPGPFRLVLRGRTADRRWLMEPDPPGEPEELLARFGQVPLPPYIRKGVAGDEDREEYQTVYAAHPGSVAAPTAGLHFTPELLARLDGMGVPAARVTLHVGLGTFAPVKVADPADHQIHSEWCEVTPAGAEAVNACRSRGGRVVAVGTTAVRTLETAARAIPPSPLEGEGSERSERVRGITPFRGDTGLYIRPPFDFRAVNALVTNFHLPRTTLLLLVGAFAGPELLRHAYEEAIRREYRFYSYGDAMLIL
ncbi:MAG: tRNA preQ1(34) S-adenosylmethionine ribosyltransferase-isomerase QueA [Gemmataceae bacterium]|nr:tRNA preQ1(34) S-adenosylmethionine ribosyltransferase-isomerase QueA [Gemmataceae bacterium]